MRLLQSFRGDSDVLFGSLATLFAGAGSVISNVHTVQFFRRPVRDALLYHAVCNAVTGLEAAFQTITRADNPGALEIGKFIGDLEKAGVTVELQGSVPRPTLNISVQ
jgi:hypothetical protein